MSDPGEALKRLIEAVGRVGASQAARLARELSDEFYADSDMMVAAIAVGRPFNIIHYASSYKFDIFPLSSAPFQRSQFARRTVKEIALGGGALVAVPVATAEDTLLMKLAWYRAGGEVSERQWNDVRGIAAVEQGRLDREYLRRWADDLKVADLLAQALARADR